MTFNILLLNKQRFGMVKSPLCSFYNIYDETPLHLFYECDYIKYLWEQLNKHFYSELFLPALTPQAALFGLLSVHINN